MRWSNQSGTFFVLRPRGKETGGKRYLLRELRACLRIVRILTPRLPPFPSPSYPLKFLFVSCECMLGCAVLFSCSPPELGHVLVARRIASPLATCPVRAVRLMLALKSTARLSAYTGLPA